MTITNKYLLSIPFILLDFVMEFVALFILKLSVWRKTTPITYYSVEIGIPLGRVSVFEMMISSSGSSLKLSTASKVDPSLLINLYWTDIVNSMGWSYISLSLLISTNFLSGFRSLTFTYSYFLSILVVLMSMLLLRLISLLVVWGKSQRKEIDGVQLIIAL